jgi:hypothetical protein
MTSVKAIKTYFESGPHGRKVTMDELRALSADDRHELGRLACVELGVEYEEPKAA